MNPIRFSDAIGKSEYSMPVDSVFIGQWERGKRKIILYQTKEDQLVAHLLGKKGFTEFTLGQIKCGIIGDATHVSMIRRINKFAREKINDNIAVFTYPSEDKIEGIWVFEATKTAATLIKSAMEKLGSINLNSQESKFYNEGIKNLETALVFQARHKGDVTELTSIIADLKSNPALSKSAYQIKIDEMILQYRKQILDNLMNWKNEEKNNSNNASLNQIQESFNETLKAWKESKPLHALISGDLGKIAEKHGNSFRQAVLSFLKENSKKTLCAEQAFSLRNQLYAWYYFMTIASIAETIKFSFESDDAQNIFSIAMLGLEEGNFIESGVETENDFILKCLNLLPILYKGKCEKFIDRLEGIAKTISSQKELDCFEVLLIALAEIPDEQIPSKPVKSLPLEAELLKKISLEDMRTNIDRCLDVLIRSSPIKDFKGKQCFVLLEEAASWPKHVQSAQKPFSWFLQFLKPSLEKLSLEVPVMNYYEDMYAHIGKAGSADLTVVIMFSELDSLIAKIGKINTKLSDFDKFLHMGLRSLEARNYENSLISNSFLINIEDNPTPDRFWNYQNLCMQNSFEDQYTILFKLVAKVCQSNPEFLEQTIDLFRQGCKDLVEAKEVPKTNSQLPQPALVLPAPKELSAFEKLVIETQKAKEKELEKIALASESLVNVISSKLQKCFENKSLPRNFHVRYDQNVFGSNSPAIAKIVKDLKTIDGINAFDYPETEKIEKKVKKVFNDYYGEEWGVETIEIKHPAILINILSGR